MPRIEGIPFLEHPEVRSFFENEMLTLINESDRGAVLVAASILDQQMRHLFEAVATSELSKSKLSRILDYPGPLSSFSAKVEIAFLCRLIDAQLFNSIQRFKKIRNEVAHSPQSFALKNHEKELFEIYDLADGLPSLIRERTGNLILQSFVENLSEKEATFGDRTIKLFENATEILEAIRDSSDAMDTFEERLHRVELGFAIGIISGLIIFHRDKAREVLDQTKLISSLTLPRL